MDKGAKRDIVFWISIAITGGFVLWGVLWPSHFENTFKAAKDAITAKMGWFYVLSVTAFLAFCLYMAFSRYGKIKLGKLEDKPEYSTLSWLSMLFAAGMGIGIMFYGVAEPILHYSKPPLGAVVPQTPQAADLAMRYTFFHWGLHAWAIYTLVGLAVAYMQYRKGESGLISATFRPLLGRRIDGPLGKGIDIFATVATAFGLAQSLGIGVMQISSGTNYLFAFPDTPTVQILIMAVMAVLFTASALSGINRGILFLSNLSSVLGIALLLFIFVAGPTTRILDCFTNAIGDYLGNLVPMSFRMTPFQESGWVGSWTIFYWAWWVAWAPYVGVFIARISKGRTVREFVLGVLLAPTLLCAIWFTVFGGAALSLEMFDHKGIADAVNKHIPSSIYVFWQNFPLAGVTSLITIWLTCNFYVSSADSATIVLGTFTSKGSLNPEISTKLTWGFLQCAIAGILLVVGGQKTLEALQTASIVSALPFTILMVFMMFSLYKAMNTEIKEQRFQEKMREEELTPMS
jgi:glycine betaine transporter